MKVFNTNFGAMISFPNAKINIGLNIIEKRSDGFHEIDSIFFPVVGLNDVLEINEAPELSFTSSGLDIPGDSQNNLCLKAFNLLKEKFDIPNVSMHLHKVIPMGAGLGGGSADGAFVINMLNELFELNISIEEKENFAAQLGSDCPFFIKNIPAQAIGRGEILNDVNVDLSKYYILMVNPDIHVGTKEAYQGVVPRAGEKSVSELIYEPIESWRQNIVNDFEQSIFPKYVEIESLKDSMYSNGAIYASMTGSGSTVYGLFKNEPVKGYFDANYFSWSGKL